MAKGKILIVDDEEIVLIAFQRELERAGYEAQTAPGGKEALELVKNGAFDIVYTDLVMPGMNGVELCKEIRKVSPRTRVILISGHSEHVMKFSTPFVLAGGQDEILRKPLGDGELVRTTEKMMAEIGDKRGETR